MCIGVPSLLFNWSLVSIILFIVILEYEKEEHLFITLSNEIKFVLCIICSGILFEIVLFFISVSGHQWVSLSNRYNVIGGLCPVPNI